VFFRQPGAGKPVSLALPSRAHAELVFALARLGLHGAVRLPEGEAAAAALKAKLDARLAANAERAQRLARSRTSDERRVEDLAGCSSTGWSTADRSAGRAAPALPRPSPCLEKKSGLDRI